MDLVIAAALSNQQGSDWQIAAFHCLMDILLEYGVEWSRTSSVRFLVDGPGRESGCYLYLSH